MTLDKHKTELKHTERQCVLRQEDDSFHEDVNSPKLTNAILPLLTPPLSLQ